MKQNALVVTMIISAENGENVQNAGYFTVYSVLIIMREPVHGMKTENLFLFTIIVLVALPGVLPVEIS